MSEDMTAEPDWEHVKAWRKSQRADLIGRRESTPDAERHAWNECITRHLVAGFEMPRQTVVGCCWPYKGEFDARFAVRTWRERGASAALPEVVNNKSPLQFRRWWPGAPMKPGVYDIPVPDGTEIVTPDVAIVPMNAFDAKGFRLGYGGGFFDSTLAACERRMIAIGVSYEMLRVETIHPQPHDIPMDFIVTEAGIYSAGGQPLERIEPAASCHQFNALLSARRLPREAFRAQEYSSPVCYAADFPNYFGDDNDAKK
jgi:5,10-methenyltetrahydrofolate synthetase